MDKNPFNKFKIPTVKKENVSIVKIAKLLGGTIESCLVYAHTDLESVREGMKRIKL